MQEQLSSITASIKYALWKLGQPVPDIDVLEKWIGPPLHDSFVEILGSPEAAARVLGLYRERFGSIGMHENRLYADAGADALCGAPKVLHNCIVYRRTGT